jgi:SAM-dependent methyltransferase
MSPSEPEVQLKAFAAASQTLNQWYVGAQALALLRAALHAGILVKLRETCTVAELAATTGRDGAWVADFCAALCALGVVEASDAGLRLSPALLQLTAADAPQTLANTLATQEARIRALAGCSAAKGSLGGMSADDVLTVALGIWGLPSSPAALASFANVDTAMPEVRTLWERGALHLELGCGAGRDLLHIALLYPKVVVVGIDLSGEALEKVMEQARALGIADRVQVQQRDACTVTDRARYDTIVWSQMYFPPETRRQAARVAYRALKPGGYLLLPLQGEPPATLDALRTPAGQQVALSRLVFQSWGLRWYSAQEVRTEMEQAGFEVVRVVPHPRTDYMLLRVNATPAGAAITAKGCERE